jgi:6-phosphogluconolactonase (cycloisomerase 2 family)
MGLRSALVLFLVVVLLWSAGCGIGAHSNPALPAPATGNGFLYVSNSLGNSISAFLINNLQGNLTPIAGFPFTTAGTAPGRLAVDRMQTFLFGLNTGSATLSSYPINAHTGALIQGGTATVPADAHNLIAHPSANFVYVLSGEAVSGFSYDAAGLLTPVGNSPQTLNAPATQGIAIDSTGSYLFVTTQLGISAFQIGTDGRLSLLNSLGAPTGTQLVDVAADPMSNLVYSVASGSGTELQGSLFGWTFTGGIGVNAGFFPVPGTPVQADLNPVWVTLVPSGSFIYIAAGSSGNGEILGYSISANGQPIPLAGSFASPPNPVQLAVDPSGKFLFALNVNTSTGSPPSVSDNISGFLISTTGVLTPAPGTAVDVASPGGIAIARVTP